MLRTRPHARGFTLVELLVTITIGSVLLLLALPSMTSYFQAAKLSAAAQGYQVGLQTARAEAIRRNLPVEFVLTESGIGTEAAAAAAVPSPSGRSWVVRFNDTTQSPAVETVIDRKSAFEGSGQAGATTITVAGVAPATSPAAFTGSVMFNGFGATTPAGSEVAITIANPAAGTCVKDGGTFHCLNVKALPGGQVLVCDPAAAVGDSRAC